jgi:hypothetical protein
VLGGRGKAAGFADHAELIIGLGLDHRGLVHQEIVAGDLVGGHATLLGKYRVLEGDRGALGTSLLAAGLAVLLLLLGAAGLTSGLAAVATVRLTVGHLLLWAEISPEAIGIHGHERTTSG